MKFTCKILAAAIFLASLIWVYAKPDFDSGIAVLTALLALSGLFISDRRDVGKLSQKISGNSTGIQANGNINIGTQNPKYKE
ncbi:hypothetical protein [Lonsdalea quercina]|uniref:hypothetical protein n=1 Tax=Lonsdalea quercina TaxID=71657 RepID=UPI003974A7E8